MATLGGEEQAVELGRIAGYLREIASFNRRAELARILSEPQQRRAYELSDGKRSAEEIAADTDVQKSERTIQRWWKDWRDQGLVEDNHTAFACARYETFVLDLDRGEG